MWVSDPQAWLAPAPRMSRWQGPCCDHEDRASSLSTGWCREQTPSGHMRGDSRDLALVGLLSRGCGQKPAVSKTVYVGALRGEPGRARARGRGTQGRKAEVWQVVRRNDAVPARTRGRRPWAKGSTGRRWGAGPAHVSRCAERTGRQVDRPHGALQDAVRPGDAILTDAGALPGPWISEGSCESLDLGQGCSCSGMRGWAGGVL